MATNPPHEDDSTALLLWAPDQFEESLGYDQGQRFVGFYWDAAWNDLAINDGWRRSVGAQWRSADGAEWDEWDDWRGQQMVENVLAPYDLGDNGRPAAHWLILDRQTRQFSILPADKAALHLRGVNPEPSPEAANAPDSSLTRSESADAPYPSEPLPSRKWDEYTI